MIYADNAATTQISDRAFEQMLPFLREQYGNASSQYSLGANAKRAIQQARKQIASAIGSATSEIIFTSSGSEANSWLLRNMLESYRDEQQHIITSSVEHSSVLNACRSLQQHGVEVTYLPVDSTGRVSVKDVEAAIRPNTKLVSIMLANNEIGTIQPIAEIGSFLNKKDILFHTDAVQAVGHIPVNVNTLQVDFLTASAHKFNGAKGTGVLYKRADIEFLPMVFGGEQEQGLRAGTENIAGIVSAGAAIEESIAEMVEMAQRTKAMVAETTKQIRAKFPSVKIHGDRKYQLPGMVNLGFDGISGESLMHLLDLKGICVSTSSACHSGKDEASHVLIALGLSEQQAKSAIRISYGKYNNFYEAELVAKAVCDAYEKILTSH